MSVDRDGDIDRITNSINLRMHVKHGCPRPIGLFPLVPTLASPSYGGPCLHARRHVFDRSIGRKGFRAQKASLSCVSEMQHRLSGFPDASHAERHGCRAGYVTQHRYLALTPEAMCRRLMQSKPQWPRLAKVRSIRRASLPSSAGDQNEQHQAL
jgi:hypothetical protein